MKKSVKLLAVSVLMSLLVVSGCKKPVDQSNSDKENDQKEKIVQLSVGYIPIAECAQLYIGIAQGFFREEGLEIKLVPMAGGAAILPAVDDGVIQLGFSNVVSLVLLNDQLIKEGKPIRFKSVAGASFEDKQHLNHALLVKRDSSIATPKDLAKSKIALNTLNNIEHLMLIRFLRAHNIPSQNLNLVPINFPQMGSALQNGDVDVISVVEPFITPFINNGDAKLFANQYAEVEEKTLVATYVSTDNWMKENAKVVKKFKTALQKATNFYKENPTESREIIGTFVRIKPEDLGVIGLSELEDKVVPAALGEIIELMKIEHWIENKIEPDSLIGN